VDGATGGLAVAGAVDEPPVGWVGADADTVGDTGGVGVAVPVGLAPARAAASAPATSAWDSTPVRVELASRTATARSATAPVTATASTHESAARTPIFRSLGVIRRTAP
jgi:hypothetical protein